MKNKERIAILEAEISRLKVANRNNIYRIEQIESHLAEQHKGANFSKLNSSEIPNSCDPFKPEAPECVANNGVSENMVKPDFIPGWKDAPEDAVCVAMDSDGRWYWYKNVPGVSFDSFIGKWINKFPDIATNAHLLPPDYWKSTLMMRPEAEKEPDYTHLLPEGYEFCDQGEHERFVKVELFGGVNEEPVGFITDYNIFIGKYLPIRKSAPDYSHLLPEGYEFCEQSVATNWVKVDDIGSEFKIGCVKDVFYGYVGTWLPIRPIQYKVTTHEITTAIPDPYQPDWSKAPEWTHAHVFNSEGIGVWLGWTFNKEFELFSSISIGSNNNLPPDLDWKQSLRVKPSK
jgi:hypothetical protein